MDPPGPIARLLVPVEQQTIGSGSTSAHDLGAIEELRRDLVFANDAFELIATSSGRELFTLPREEDLEQRYRRCFRTQRRAKAQHEAHHSDALWRVVVDSPATRTRALATAVTCGQRGDASARGWTHEQQEARVVRPL